MTVDHTFDYYLGLEDELGVLPQRHDIGDHRHCMAGCPDHGKDLRPDLGIFHEVIDARWNLRHDVRERLALRPSNLALGELRRFCQFAGLPVTGNKATLLKRLQYWVETQPTGTRTSVPD